MTTRLIVGVLAWVCGTTCAIYGSITLMTMTNRVNERLPIDQRFATTGWHAFKSWGLIRVYGSLYPAGPLLKRFRRTLVLMVAAWLVVGWCVGLLGPPVSP